MRNENIKATDETLTYSLHSDSEENDFEPLNDMLQLFPNESHHEYQGRRILLIAELVGKDHVQKHLYVELQ